MIYDAAGRQRFVVDALGDVTETRYDAAGRVAESLSYLAALSSTDLNVVRGGTATLNTFTTFVATNAINARASKMVYDAAGRVVYTLTRSDITSQAAVVSERRYNALGQVLADVSYGVTILYGTAGNSVDVVAAMNPVSGNLAANQRVTRYAYDVSGRLRFTINNGGEVSEQRYNALNQVTQTLRYGQAISVSQATETNVAAALVGQTGTRFSTNAYDASGHLISTTDALNGVESYTYNASGQVLTRTNKLGYVWTYSYDSVGRQIEERSPSVNVAHFVNDVLTIEAKSVVTRTTYDAVGNVLTRTENAEAIDPLERRTTQYQYDARGRQIKTIFPDAYRLDNTGALVATNTQSSIQVAYNSLDQAVVQKDVRGNYTYKVYDVLGRAAYDIDAEGFVTGYSYNAYGEQTGITRYAGKLITTGLVAGRPISAAQVQAGVSEADPSNRTLMTSYDARGLKTQVTQPLISYYKANATTAVSGNPITVFVYDAYGQKVKESLLIEGTPGTGDAVWADSYSYFDSLGRQTLTVDAEGYVSAWQYNGFGETVIATEYARAISTSGLSTITPPSLPAAGDATTGYDRRTVTTFDALGRKSSDTVLRHYQLSNLTEAQRDIVNAYTYNAEGQLVTTNTDGVVTQTAYDALGRTLSVTEAERDVLRGDAESLLQAQALRDLYSSVLYERASPYTDMVYDAFGNAVRVTRYANGWRNGGVMADSTRDQVMITRYDYQGRAVVTTDAQNLKTYNRYNEADGLVESWYTLTGNDGRGATVRTLLTYDAVGRQTSNVVQRETYRTYYGVTTVGDTIKDAQEYISYNGFGEVTSKGFDGSTQPIVFIYDAAGRLKQSNANAGILRTYGYNLAGYQQNETHKTLANGLLFDANTYQVTDKLGRAITTRLPSYTDDTAVQVAVSFKFDRWGNTTEVVDTRGYQTLYQYNQSNQVTQETQALVKVVSETGVASWIRPVKRWFYDVQGREIANQDANGNVHGSEYDATGRLIRTRGAVNPSTNVTTYAYDALGNQRLTQDALNYLTFRSFDKNGRISSKGDYLLSINGYSRTQNTLESYQLNANGDRNVVTDAMGTSSKYDYDSRHLLLRSQSAMGVITGYSYDAQGNKIREDNAMSNTEYGAYLQPRYNGGLAEYQPIIAGSAYSLVIPEQAFITTAGSALTYEVVVTHTAYINGQYQTTLASGFTFDANTRTLSNSNVVQDGYYITITARSSNGSHTSKTISLNSMSVADYNTFNSQAPYLSQALIYQSANVNQAWTYQIPANTFVDPQGQALTYSVQIGTWVPGTPGIPGEPGDPGYVDYRALNANDWLQFNASTRTLSGTPTSANGPAQLKIIATDPNGNWRSIEFVVNVANSYVGSTVQDNNDLINGLPSEWVKPNEQTWDYDAFGRLIDHNDLSAVDYNYFYDSQTAQQTSQTNNWSQTTVTLVANNFQIGNITVPLAPLQQNVTTTGLRQMFYYANGQLKELRENGNIYRYAYDAAGNRTLEESEVHDADGSLITLRTRTVYDSHNRVEHLTQDQVTSGVVRRILDMAYSYDANGNRRNVQSFGALNTAAAVIATTNLAPGSVQAIPTQNLRSGIVSVFRLRPSEIFKDPEQDGLTYTAKLVVGGVDQNLPSWLAFTIDAATGEAVFTASAGSTAALGQDLSIKLIATENAAAGSKTANTTFVVSVRSNIGPVLLNTNTPSFRAKPGVNFELELAASQFFRDADIGDILSLSLESGSALPPGVVLDASNPQALRLTGIPTTPNTYTIFLRATDQQGLFVTKAITLNANTNVAPTAVLTNLTSQTWIAGRQGTYDIPLSQAFTDADADALTISATLANGSPLPSWMTVQLITNAASPPTLRFRGEPPANTVDSTSFSFKITATDNNGASAITNLGVLVKQNQAATGGGTLAIPAPRVGEDYAFVGNLFTDPEGDLLAYQLTFTANDPTANWLSLSIDRTTGKFTLSGKPTVNTQGGARSVQLIATDAGGLTTTLTITFTVKTDTAPTLANAIPDQVVLKSRNFSYVVPATAFNDVDGDSLSYEVYNKVFIPGHTDGEGMWEPDHYEFTSLPSWLTFDSATRTFRGTAPATVQTTEIYIVATDSKGRFVDDSFNITNTGVASNSAPTYTAGSLISRSASEGVAVDFVLPGNAFGDTNSDLLTYVAQIKIGTTWTTLPALGLSIDKYTGRITGVPTGPTATTYQMRITASDGAASITSAEFTMSMNRIPVLATAFSNRSNNVNAAISNYQFTASQFTDATSLAYSATGLPPGIIFTPATRTFSGTPTQMGTYTVSVTASDGTLTRTGIFTWTVTTPSNSSPYVANVLVDQGAFKDTAWTYTVPSNTFVDSNGNPLAYTATLADGSALPSWMSFNAGTRTFSGTPATTGPISLKVTATDGILSATALMTLSVTVAGNTGPTVVSAIPDQLFHKNDGLSFQVPYRSFVDANQGDALTLTATLSNGSALPSWLTFDPNNGTFYVRPNASITFNNFPETHKLPLTIKVTARDGSYASTSQTFVLTAVKDDPNSLPSGYVDPFVAADAQKNYWYTYDAENRLLVNHGQLINGGTGQAQIVIGQDDISSGQVYDAVGRMVGRQIGYGGNISVEVSSYSQRGLLLNVYQPVLLGQSQTNSALQDSRTYDANGHLLSTTTYFRLAETRETTTANQFVNIGGWVKHRDIYTYNLDGQVVNQYSEGRARDWKAPVTPNVSLETNIGTLIALSTVKSTYLASYVPGQMFGYEYHYIAHESGTGTSSTDAVNYTHYYSMSYEGRDGYLETSVRGGSSNTTFKASTSVSQYDAWGKRLSVREQTPLPSNMGTMDDRVRYFTYDGEGGILRRREGIIDGNNLFAQNTDQESRDMLYAFANRQLVGKQSRAGKLDIASLQGMELSGGGSSQTTVQTGENLQAVAQRVYGNSSLWYVLAEANAIGNSEITAGTTLKVPDVGQHKNDAVTFKPYNPADTIGNTSPTLPYIPAPEGPACWKIVVMMVVIIVVTYFTAGAATEATGSMMIGAFAGGVAGSVAGQLVGKSLGIVDHFSLREAVASGITSMITAGITAGMGEAINGSRVAAAAVKAALNSVAGYIGNKIAGVPDTHFSWKTIAASAVANFVTTAVLGDAPSEGAAKTGPIKFSLSDFRWSDVAEQFGRAMFSKAVHAAAEVAITGKSVGDNDIGMVMADAFGTALGQAVIAGSVRTADRTSKGMTKAQYKVFEQTSATLARLTKNAPPRQADEFGSFDLDSALDNLEWAEKNFGSRDADASQSAAQGKTVVTQAGFEAAGLSHAERSQMIKSLKSFYSNEKTPTSYRDFSDSELSSDYDGMLKILSSVESPGARELGTVYVAGDKEFERNIQWSSDWYFSKGYGMRLPEGIHNQAQLDAFNKNQAKVAYDDGRRRQIDRYWSNQTPKTHSPVPEKPLMERLYDSSPMGMTNNMLLSMADETLVAIGFGETYKGDSKVEYRISPLKGTMMDGSEVRMAKVMALANLMPAGRAEVAISGELKIAERTLTETSERVAPMLENMTARVGANTATPLSPTLMSETDPALSFIKNVKPIDGYTDVAVHGSKDKFWYLKDATAPTNPDSWISFNQRSLANYVKGSDYSGGPIRLLSCETGAADAVAAQNFSNKMGVEILAPTDTLWIFPSGRMSIGPSQFKNTGTWESFFPKKPGG